MIRLSPGGFFYSHSYQRFAELSLTKTNAMFLIILGIIILIGSVTFLSHNEHYLRFRSAIRWLGTLFIALGILSSCIVQIDAGYIGVKVLFGNIQNDVLGSGLHFVNPLLKIEKVDVKTQNYTMSGVQD